MIFMKKYKDYLILTIFAMGTQALLYFLIKLFINDYNMLNSIINVPLVKQFIYVYNSWYPFIILNTFLIYKHDRNMFKCLITSMIMGAIMAQITFIVYPSEIIRPTIEVKNFTDWFLNFTYTNDTPAINCLPSMHCVYCFITSYYMLKSNVKYKYFVVFYSVLIVLSTLFTKQHIIEDVFLALIYTIIAIIIVNFNKDKIIRLFNKLKLN